MAEETLSANDRGNALLLPCQRKRIAIKMTEETHSANGRGNT